MTCQPASGKEMLRLCDVALHYRERSILHNINISATKGEVIGVVGHNGAGKTTFSRAICGLHKDCEGQFLWEGKPMDRKARLKRSYMVMQDVNHQLFTNSVLSEVLLSMEHPDEKAAEKILESLDLDEYKEKHPMALSGGQKQRVAIASAIAAQAQILLFDEPTSGLDYRHMREVAELLKRLAAEGKTIFVSTHDPELIALCCDKIIRITEGRAQEVG